MGRACGASAANFPSVRPAFRDVYDRPKWNWNEQLHIVHVRDLGLVDVGSEWCSYIQCQARHLL